MASSTFPARAHASTTPSLISTTASGHRGQIWHSRAALFRAPVVRAVASSDNECPAPCPSITAPSAARGGFSGSMPPHILRGAQLCAARRNRQKTLASARANGEPASRAQKLRELMGSPGILKGPCCHDGLSARMIERAGFDYAFMSGFCTSAARLGAPDAGLLSYYEMVDQGRYVNEATESMPIIGDGDTGYGNAMNVKRTVKGYAAAGFAGILIEDQVWPKSCGHVAGKRVVPRDEAVSRIKAAVDAREEGADIVIVARTDARQAVSFSEALERAQAFAEAGADILFIDALESREEMQAFCDLGGAAAEKPKMANMLEGGGKTPILPPEDLQEMGFKLVAYPMSLLAVSVQAMESALQGLRTGNIPGPEAMPTFKELQAVVGFPEYFEESAKYAVDSSALAAEDAAGRGVASALTKAAQAPLPESAELSKIGNDQAAEQLEAEILNAETGPAGQQGQGGMPLLKDAAEETSKGIQRDGRFFRVRIAEKKSDMVKLETRIPALFINNLETLVPQVSGMNLAEVVKMAKGDETWDPLKPLVEVDSGDTDILQIWLE